MNLLFRSGRFRENKGVSVFFGALAAVYVYLKADDWVGTQAREAVLNTVQTFMRARRGAALPPAASIGMEQIHFQAAEGFAP